MLLDDIIADITKKATAFQDLTVGTTQKSLYGDTISTKLVIPNLTAGGPTHTWVADSKGLYHTATDLKAEWQGYYALLKAGHGDQLNFIQHLEASAEAVFENTRLAKLGAADLVRDREDVQRQYDAMAGAFEEVQAGAHPIDLSHPLTDAEYLQMEQALQSTPALLELGLQGHGLNKPPSALYNGFTNDFQNNVDGKTLYIGGGLDNNEKALANFFDDVILSHAPFAVVVHDGVLTQINQNAAREDTLTDAVIAQDEAGYIRTYLSTDFSTSASHANDGYVSPATNLVTVGAVAGPGQMVTLYGDVISTTITVNSLSAGGPTHVWTAGPTGLFHTATDLKAEWQGYYLKMLNGQGSSLNAIQRLEGNAEAVFENTRLNLLGPREQAQDREDVQREFDAIQVAMEAEKAGPLHIDPNSPLTNYTYTLLGRTIQSTPELLELGLQGHGLNKPPSVIYSGYTNDFQHNVDNSTLYVGSGLDHNERAIADFFDDALLSHLPFAVVVHNGVFTQLNQNGNLEDKLSDSVAALSSLMYGKVLKPSDFSHPERPGFMDHDDVPGAHDVRVDAAGTIRLATEALRDIHVGDRDSDLVVHLSSSSGTAAVQGVNNIQLIDGTLTFDPNAVIAKVMRLYDSALGRSPDELGLHNWTMAVKGGVALNQAADAFAASAEFAARFGTTDNGGYVEALYANTLHRGSDAAGKAAWVAALAGGASRGEVLLGFSESAEHQANTANVVNAGIFDINETAVELARLYDTALGRLPDRAGLAAWTQAIEAGSVTLGQAINGFIASAEFQQTFGNLDNASFVSLLYNNALNRAPDAGGLAAWVDALNHGVGRADIVLGFSESAEHIANTASNVYLSNQGAPGLLFA